MKGEAEAKKKKEALEEELRRKAEVRAQKAANSQMDRDAGDKIGQRKAGEAQKEPPAPKKANPKLDLDRIEAAREAAKVANEELENEGKRAA